MWKEQVNEFPDKREAWNWFEYNVLNQKLGKSKNTLRKNLQEALINFQRHPNDDAKKELGL